MLPDEALGGALHQVHHADAGRHRHAEVDAGAESASRAVEQDRAHAGALGRIELLDERVAQLGVDRVVAVGAIQGQVQDRVVAFASEGHEMTISSSCGWLHGRDD